MKLSISPDITISKQYFGQDKAPILVVDNFIQQIDQLVEFGKILKYSQNSPNYPGVRAATPKEYQQLILQALQPTLVNFFNLPNCQLVFPVSHYSVLTTAPANLSLLQKIPHFDSIESNGLAAVHYLFKEDLGGTAFYRHRQTGYEVINQARHSKYMSSLKSENSVHNMPTRSDGYINHDTALFEKVSEQAAKYNRIIFYRRNSLHSGAIPSDMFQNNTPKGVRLTISNFIDCE